jgi:hypothetical protein
MPDMTAVRCEGPGNRCRFTGRLRQDTGKAILIEVKSTGSRRSVWLPTWKIRRRSLGDGNEEITMAVVDAWEKGFEIVEATPDSPEMGPEKGQNRAEGRSSGLPAPDIGPKV